MFAAIVVVLQHRTHKANELLFAKMHSDMSTVALAAEEVLSAMVAKATPAKGYDVPTLTDAVDEAEEIASDIRQRALIDAQDTYKKATAELQTDPYNINKVRALNAAFTKLSRMASGKPPTLPPTT